MDSDEEEEEQEVAKSSKFPIAMYITEGNKYFRLLKYNKAIEFYSNALEIDPRNEKSLIGRSECYMRLGNYTVAKQDAEEALKTNTRSSEAKLLIGEAEYLSGDFEKSFLTFYRGHEVRPNCEGFKLGFQMCSKAIENALQPDEPMTIGDEDVADLAKLKLKGGGSGSSNRKTRKDKFSSDIEFLEKLLSDDLNASVHPDCEFLLYYLKDRQMFWRTQNPQTSRKK